MLGGGWSAKRCTCRLFRPLEAGFVAPGRGWEDHILTDPGDVSGPGAPPEDLLTRGVSTLGELWELGNSIQRILRICKALEGSGRFNLSYFTCLESSGRLNLSYFTCLGGSICRILCVWEGQILTDLSGPKPT